MKKLLTVAALTAVTALALAGCSSRTEAPESSGEAAAGFPADSLVGVALPDGTSENWVLAESLFNDALTEAGFEADVQNSPASNTVAEQQNQINSMVTNGAKVIIIGAKDGAQLSSQVEAARAAGVTVIAYDRLILNTEAVDYYLAFDNFRVGELQGQALLDGLAAKFPDADSYNVELFSGSPDDNNAGVFFNGAMSVLQPKIDDGTLNVVSGQVEVGQTATQGWLAQNAQSRMDTILSANYGSTELHGVLSPNDTLARAILESVRAAGKPLPVVTGQDSEVESVRSIVAGEQYMTIYKDTRALVAAAVEMVKTLQAGNEPEVNDTESYDNGVLVVPSFLLDPVVVTSDNAAQAYADNADLLAATEG